MELEIAMVWAQVLWWSRLDSPLGRDSVIDHSTAWPVWVHWMKLSRTYLPLIALQNRAPCINAHVVVPNNQTQILWTRRTHATFYPTEFSPAFNIPAPSPGISNLTLRTVITITETNFPERERLALLGRGFSSEAFFSLAQNRVGGHLQIDFLTQSTNVFLYFVPIKIPEICQCHLLPLLCVIIQKRSHCTDLAIGWKNVCQWSFNGNHLFHCFCISCVYCDGIIQKRGHS